MPDAILKISDIEGDFKESGTSISVNMFSQDVNMDTLEATQVISLSPGWNIIGTYIDATTSNAANYGTFAESSSIVTFLSQLNVNDNLQIAKNYLGSVYLPEFNFNGIGNVINGQAYQVKINTAQIITITGRPIISTSQPFGNGTPIYTSFGMEQFPLVSGWNMITPPLNIGSGFGSSFLGSYDVASYFEHATSDFDSSVEELIIILKDYV